MNPKESDENTDFESSYDERSTESENDSILDESFIENNQFSVPKSPILESAVGFDSDTPAHSYNSNDSFAAKYLIHVPNTPETPVFEPQLFNSNENLDFAEDLQLNHEQLTEIHVSGSNLLPPSLFSSKHFTHTMYLIFIRPLLEYAGEVWDNCTLADSERLEQIQLEAARDV